MSNQPKLIKIKNLPNRSWCYLPLSEKKIMKLYGTDCRTRVFTGNKPVKINGKFAFSTSMETDIGSDTEVLPVDPPEGCEVEDENQEIDLEQTLLDEQDEKMTEEITEELNKEEED